MYDNEIGNNVFLAGDSHQNWVSYSGSGQDAACTNAAAKVSDLAWLGIKDYDSESGEGAIGVEFAGTAVSSTGKEGPIEPVAGDAARGMVNRNEEMHWQEGYYRGYFRLAVTPKQVAAQFFGASSAPPALPPLVTRSNVVAGSPSVASRNSWDLPLANFTVDSSDNHLSRPVADGRAESGGLKYGGEILHSKT